MKKHEAVVLIGCCVGFIVGVSVGGFGGGVFCTAMVVVAIRVWETAYDRRKQ